MPLVLKVSSIKRALVCFFLNNMFRQVEIFVACFGHIENIAFIALTSFKSFDSKVPRF